MKILDAKSAQPSGCKMKYCLTCGNKNIPRGSPVVESSICDKFDFGLHYKTLSQLSMKDRISMVSNIWKPDINFEFPSHFACNKHVRMSYEFLNPESEKYLDWLIYSKFLDGCFCLHYSLFGQFETDFTGR